MKYPTISLSDTEGLVPDLLRGETADLQAAVRWVGEGAEIDLGPLSSLAKQIANEIAGFGGSAPKPDDYEGRQCGGIHLALRDLPLPVLDDPGFWRYLALVHFWELITWREPKALSTGDWARIRPYVDGTAPTECIPLRMFIRGQIAWDGSSHELASAVPDATDFWRSHIVRVRTGYSPVLAQAFVRLQRDRRMATFPLRQFAKRINRVASNVLLHTYDDAKAEELLAELYDD